MLDSLEQSERKVFSQNGEDGVIAAIFDAIGTTNRYFVEFGCQWATECNTALLLEEGWQGLLMDSEGACFNPKAVVRKEYVTAENINYLFDKYGVPLVFDLLSIDIDGNDYWVWRTLAWRARVVVIEYNPFIPPDQRRTIRYEPFFQWIADDYFGASLLALKELGEQKGYTLIYCDSTGTNAFFVANEALPAGFTRRPIETIYRPPNPEICLPKSTLRQMIDPANEPQG